MTTCSGTTTTSHGTVSLDPTTGCFTYTPAPNYVGKDTACIIVCKNGVCDTTLVPIDVTPKKDTLPIVTPQNTPITVCKPLITDMGPGSTMTTCSGTTTTSHGTVSLDPTTGCFTYTPAPGYAGKDTACIIVCKNGVCDTTIVPIDVKSVADPRPDMNETFINVPVNGNVATNDNMVPGSTYGIPVPASTNPTGAIMKMNLDGTYTFSATQPGTYVYNVPVCAPGQTSNCSTTLLTISVLDPGVTNNPPAVNTDIAATIVGTPVVLKTLANDLANGVGLKLVPSTVVVITQPKHGTTIVNPSTGDISYAPLAGFVGNDTLYYRVCDDATPSQCATAMQVISVKAVGSANTTIGSDDYNTTSGSTPATGNVLANDSDPEKNVQTVIPQSQTLPEGKFMIGADGSYTFTPADGYVGPVNIPYRVCDNGTPQACTQATLYILVTKAPSNECVLMPNVFTPNGDGINDVIKPIIPCLKKFRCYKVYNRWGNLVFETTDTNIGWDGTFRNKQQPAESYIWLVEGLDAKGEKLTKSGMFTLIR